MPSLSNSPLYSTTGSAAALTLMRHHRQLAPLLLLLLRQVAVLSVTAIPQTATLQAAAVA